MDAQLADQGAGGVRRRLGRGLSALLGSSLEDTGQQRDVIPLASVRDADNLHQGPDEAAHALPRLAETPAQPASDEIALELIERNPFQPRREFEQASLDELADSIRRHGILQPLLVRVRPDGEAGYQLIAGERRWRAAQQVGLETVPCRVIGMEDRQASEAALEENLKREDLNVLDKARAFRDYLERFGGTVEELGRQLSLSRAAVSNMMRLLDLSAPVQQLVRDAKLSGGHARALLSLPETQQVELALRVVEEQMSVRQVEEIVRELLRTPVVSTTDAAESPEGVSQKPTPALSNHVLSLQDHLRAHLGAKIDIRQKKNDAGQIVIHFSSNDDFERIVGRLRQAG